MTALRGLERRLSRFARHERVVIDNAFDDTPIYPPLHIRPATSAPTDAAEGDLYVHGTTGLEFHNGSAWVTLASVDLAQDFASTLDVTGAATFDSTVNVTGLTTVAALTSTGTVTTGSSPMTPGTGISTGSGTVYTDRVYRQNNVIKTEVFIDLTGLASSTAGDIIGVDGGTANCHIGQITTAVNGLIFKGVMSCVETPATGEDDIDLYSATEATGAEDVAISGLTETAILDAGANWTKGVQKVFTGDVVADQYLYLVSSGGGTAGVYTAGMFMIELWGYVA